MKTGTSWLCLYLSICASTWYQETFALDSALSIVKQWSQLEFDYATEAERQRDIHSGRFDVGHISPIDTDAYNLGKRDSKIFITIPRLQAGIPATVGYVTNKTYKGNPVIAPYPSWEWNRAPSNSSDCAQDRIVSVFRAKVDECGRLWLLDDGARICPAQILAFDLKTDQLVHRYEIPGDQLQSNSLLLNPIVDVRATCQDVFVYAADGRGMALIVHDVAKMTSWQIIDKTFYPYPSYGTFNLAGERFDFMDGIVGMDLSPYKPGKDRILFYHATSSPTENWVRTSDIRNQTRFANDPSPDPNLFHTYPLQRNTQCPAQAIDKNGISFFGLVTPITLNCWNTNVEYSQNTIGELANNRNNLQFISGIKVKNNLSTGKQDLWFISMRLQKLATGTLNPSEINFRIQTANIDKLLLNSKCLLK